MASKPIYIVVAAVGIALASGAAWWLQRAPVSSGGTPQASAGAKAPAAPVAGGAGTAGPARPPTVEVARVETVRLSDDAQAVGSLRSRQSVMLRPEVSGRVRAINFQDGQRVRRGQVLVQFDDQLAAAQMQQANAELSIARANHKRNQELVAQNFISQRSVDESAANMKVAEAKLALAEATASRLRLVAPFDGIAGISGINVGDYLKDGADIVNIEDLDAIFVDFRLPERYQTKVQRGQRATVEVDALPGRRFAAVVQAIDPAVDAEGRSVSVRACIDNRELVLRPGMFARVNALFGTRENARVIPEEALVPQAGRQFVYKLVDGPDQDTKIAQRVEVKLGLRSPGRVEITEGLQASDVVITAGQQRVQRDGMPVRVLDSARAGGAGGGGDGARMAARAASAASPASAPASAPVAAAPAPAPAAGDPCSISANSGDARRGARRT